MGHTDQQTDIATIGLEFGPEKNMTYTAILQEYKYTKIKLYLVNYLEYIWYF